MWVAVMIITVGVTLISLIAGLALFIPFRLRKKQLDAWKPVADRLQGEFVEQPASTQLILVLSVLVPWLYPLWKKLAGKVRLFSIGAKLDGVEVTAIPFHLRVYDRGLSRELTGMRSDNSYRTYVEAVLPGENAGPSLRMGPVVPIKAQFGDVGMLSHAQQDHLQALGRHLGYLMVGPKLIIIELDSIVEDHTILVAAMKLAASFAAPRAAA